MRLEHAQVLGLLYSRGTLGRRSWLQVGSAVALGPLGLSLCSCAFQLNKIVFVLFCLFILLERITEKDFPLVG